MDANNRGHLRSIVTEYGYMRTVEVLANMARTDGFAALASEIQKLYDRAEQADDTILERVATS